MTAAAGRLGWYRRKSPPAILQDQAAECGLACLAMIAVHCGMKTDLGALRRKHNVAGHGTTLHGVMDMASAMGFRARPLRFELGEIGQLHTPCILHWNLNHFVVLNKVSNGGIVVLDPAAGEKKYLLAEASRHVTGVALELIPAADFDQRGYHPSPKLRIAHFWTRTPGLKRALVQTLALSLVLQGFVIGSPLYMQLVVDDVVVKQDLDLLLVLLVGFSLLHLVNLVASTLRSYVLLHVGSLVSFQLIGNLFRHMVRLPIAYFEGRHVGDVISRFQSTRPLQKLLTEDLVAGLVDGTMAIATLAMMFIYSPLLSWIVVGVLLVYVAVSFAILPTYRSRTRDNILAQAKESSNFIETVRAMQPIRLFGGENDREAVWQGFYADAVNTGIRLGHVNITYGFLRTLATSVETLAVIYLAAKLVLSSQLSIGMVFAFVAWKSQFSGRLLSLLQKGLDLKMLDLHLQRLSDIVQTKKEAGFDVPPSRHVKLRGELAATRVSFSYGETSSPVLDRIDFQAEPGDIVAITGPSGGGKTTLIKVLAGLLEPTAGEVVVDGCALTSLGIRNYRAQVATVMQDDQLLSGSILDNICFFDQRPDHRRIEHCAKLACIHDEIMMMPMKYQTAVGDMGTFLSGGQKQRIVLARALYRAPRILFIDEGTSHLDVAAEARINRNLKALEITRVIVAHRPETISTANRVFALEDRTLVPVSPERADRL